MIRYLLTFSILFIGCVSEPPKVNSAATKQVTVAPITTQSDPATGSRTVEIAVEEIPEETFHPDRFYKLIIKSEEVQNRYEWLVQQARLVSETEPLVISDEYDERLRLWAKEHAISGVACQLLYESSEIVMGDPTLTDPPWFTVTNIPENFAPSSDLLELCTIEEWFTPRGSEGGK